MAAFEVSEYRGRVRRVSEAMARAGIDTLVVFSEASICYLSGYEGFSDYVPQVAVLRAGDQDVTLILREMDIYCAYPTVYLDHSRIESYPESYIGTPARTPWEAIGARIVALASSSSARSSLACACATLAAAWATSARETDRFDTAARCRFCATSSALCASSSPDCEISC